MVGMMGDLDESSLAPSNDLTTLLTMNTNQEPLGSTNGTTLEQLSKDHLSPLELEFSGTDDDADDGVVMTSEDGGVDETYADFNQASEITLKVSGLEGPIQLTAPLEERLNGTSSTLQNSVRDQYMYKIPPPELES
ncbi:unnamed protein product [Protopolystoma xenopodis]|uniref:Uncharacterized protein n=1 Tax=Protopolystoma xenopodis TaxID=117903 RepID=A0A3S5AZ21_9PLAT|nr:unnamed protein product [Protopolystoma xenopodis]